MPSLINGGNYVYHSGSVLGTRKVVSLDSCRVENPANLYRGMQTDRSGSNRQSSQPCTCHLPGTVLIKRQYRTSRLNREMSSLSWHATKYSESYTGEIGQSFVSFGYLAP